MSNGPNFPDYSYPFPGYGYGYDKRIYNPYGQGAADTTSSQPFSTLPTNMLGYDLSQFNTDELRVAPQTPQVDIVDKAPDMLKMPRYGKNLNAKVTISV